MVDKDKGKGETTWGGSQGLARLAASALGVLATEALLLGLHKHPCGLMIEPAQSAMCTRESVRGNSMQIMLCQENLQRCQLTGHGLSVGQVPFTLLFQLTENWQDLERRRRARWFTRPARLLWGWMPCTPVNCWYSTAARSSDSSSTSPCSPAG